MRPILDLRHWNVHLKRIPFCMLNLKQVIYRVSQHDRIVTVNSKDAFFHIRPGTDGY